MKTLFIMLAVIGITWLIRRLRRKFNTVHDTAVPVRQNQPIASTIHGADTTLPVDWMTDPAYYWMIGNVYNDDWCDHAGVGCDPSGVYGGCHHLDWITDPNCAHMPGNIYDYDLDPCNQHDDQMSSSYLNCTDDDWSSCSSPCGWHDND
jgi:hypothetical protein